MRWPPHRLLMRLALPPRPPLLTTSCQASRAELRYARGGRSHACCCICSGWRPARALSLSSWGCRTPRVLHSDAIVVCAGINALVGSSLDPRAAQATTSGLGSMVGQIQSGLVRTPCLLPHPHPPLPPPPPAPCGGRTTGLEPDLCYACNLVVNDGYG